ncbi:MAG: transcriptional regulator [Flavobacteriales bacterium]|jgi:DNA-binding transcriptional ArsR family regulator|nr:transcriptional regulator [Flavobacteriales bacterium]MCI1751634.1 transcriptional regulator [Flavobacteriales bacterium]
MAFAPLDPVLHNQLRLAIASLLVGLDGAEFNFLLEKTGATRGNLSAQISNLKDAGYVEVKKSFKDNYPNTRCSLTAKGLKAFETYVQAIKEYLGTVEG